MKENKEELHVFIIWSKGLKPKDKILKDIRSKFEIIKAINTTWSKNKFSENLSRFYGENLPKNSSKEKHCGTGTFLSVIVKDKNPIYDLRLTSKGTKSVNVNMFDAKQLYRRWTGGGHKIHASDNVSESQHNIFLLYGVKYADLLSGNCELPESYEKDIQGSHGWKSLNDIFKALNELTDYVVLRNYENIDSELNKLHPDIDILTSNKRLFADIINGKKTHKKNYRVQYLVLVNKKNVYFDLRYIGDNYYDYKWQQNILYNKVKYKSFYVPNDKNHFYSLMYHAFIHKPDLSEDYILRLIEMSSGVKLNYSKKSFVEYRVLNDLNDFMLEHAYDYVEPLDLSVFFNESVIQKFKSIQLSERRFFYEKKRILKLKIKKLIFKILRQG